MHLLPLKIKECFEAQATRGRRHGFAIVVLADDVEVPSFLDPTFSKAYDGVEASVDVQELEQKRKGAFVQRLGATCPGQFVKRRKSTGRGMEKVFEPDKVLLTKHLRQLAAREVDPPIGLPE